MTTLVTGGAGYVGSHTAVALHESGRDVVLLDNFANSSPAAVTAVRGLTTSSMPFVEVDMLDSAALGRVFDDHAVSEVVHFAGLKAVGDSVELPLDYYSNNLGSTLNLVSAMVEHGVDRIVFSSSCTVYGNPDTVPVTEDSPTGATNPYGWTKFMIERMLVDMCATAPLRSVLLRYFNPIGAHPSGAIGEDPRGTPNNLVPYIMQVAVGRLERLRVYGDDYDTPDGTAIRDYIHVADLADGHVAALDALAADDTDCLIVNLGTGAGSSVLEVVAAAEKVSGAPIPFEIVDRRAGDIERIWADPSRAEEVLGWKAERDLVEMLRDHWNWQRLNPDGFGG
jgi:UDP-glucose 4-epimerase